MNDVERELLALGKRAAGLLVDVGVRALDKGLDSVLDDAGQLTDEAKHRIARARERLRARARRDTEPSPPPTVKKSDGNPFGGG